MSGKRAPKLIASLCKGSAVQTHLAGSRNGKQANVAWWDEGGEGIGDEVGLGWYRAVVLHQG